MSIVNILLSIPVMFYVSIALFFLSIVVQLKLAGAADNGTDEGEGQPRGLLQKKEIWADASLAGVIGFGLLIVYFTLNIVTDWRESRGIFYPEDRISVDNLPFEMPQEVPPAPPALEEAKK